jgi:hypothetical protein
MARDPIDPFNRFRLSPPDFVEKKAVRVTLGNSTIHDVGLLVACWGVVALRYRGIWNMFASSPLLRRPMMMVRRRQQAAAVIAVE